MATLIQSLQHILAQKDPLLANETKRIVLKEVLQVYALDFLFNNPDYRRLNFYGGTCLHLLFGLNRLSEDIDLDNRSGLNITSLDQDLAAYFKAVVAYPQVSVKQQQGAGGILRITLKFPVLYDLGLSANTNEVLHLKVEISTHQQVAVIRKTPLLSFGRSFVPAHFSLETMMAGKMLACLERKFQKGTTGSGVKGRDFYDLLWFMQRQVQPLEEKLAKDGSVPYTVSSAMQALTEKVGLLRVSDLAVDLLPLFEQRSYIQSWLEVFKENFMDLSSRY